MGSDTTRERPIHLPIGAGSATGSAARGGSAQTSTNPRLSGHYENPTCASLDALGEPLSINRVARILGCSAWTIRQRYIPAGLPHFRLAKTGKLVFFHNQIIRWVLETQEKERR